IPIFDVPEIAESGHIVTIPSEPEKNIAETSTTDRIEKGKDSSPTPPITDETQELFDSIIDQPECSVASSSKSTNISVTPEIEYVESLDDKLETPEIVEESEIQGYTLSVENEPEISINSSVENDKPESSNE
ncbi:2552_t:CDS:1, partial [Gigaspora margarita]